MNAARPLLVGLLAVSALLAGCTAGAGDDADVLQSAKDAIAAGDLVLYLNLTVNGQTYAFASDQPEPPQLQLPPAPPPLEVEATLEATGLPTGDADLAWTLDWGDTVATGAAGNSSQGNATATGTVTPPSGGAMERQTGSEFPARLRHTYGEGVHQLTAGLAMAGETLDQIAVPVDVGGQQAPGVPAGTELGEEPFDASGKLPLGLGGCGPDAQQDFPWAFAADVNGTPAEVSRIVLALSTEGLAEETGLAVLDANGTVVAEAQGNGPDQALDAVGPFPPGAYTVRVVGCTTVDASYSVDGAATYVAAGAREP